MVDATSEEIGQSTPLLANRYKKRAVKLEEAAKFAEDDLFCGELATGKK